jgi:AhpD family alkylhydroperoxidase
MAEQVDPSDKRFMRNYKTASPDILQAYAAFSGTVFAADGRAIPKKYRELMGIAVAMTTQCPWCIEAHTAGAIAEGATEEEIAEAVWVSAAVRAGGSYTHGRLAFKHGDAHFHPEA